MTRDKKRKVGMTAPKPKPSPKQIKPIKVKQKMRTVNKLDDIWEFEKFIQSIINSALEAVSNKTRLYNSYP